MTHRTKVDPWVLIEWNGQSKRTHVARNVANARWNETFRFNETSRIDNPDVRVTLFAGEVSNANENDIIGNALIK